MTEGEKNQKQPKKEEKIRTISSIVDEVHNYLDKLNIDVEYLHGVNMLGETFYQVERIILPKKFKDKHNLNDVKGFLKSRHNEVCEKLYQIKDWRVRHNIEYSLFHSPELIGGILSTLSDPERVVYK